MENKIKIDTQNYSLFLSFNKDKIDYEIVKEVSKKLEEMAVELFLNK